MKLLFSIMTLILVCKIVSAQNNLENSLAIKEKIYPASCEENNSQLSILNQYTTQNEIAEYVLTAQGSASEDAGYLDFYVKGKSALRIYFKKNNDLRIPPCVLLPEEKPCETGYEKLIYPCKSNNKK